MHIVLSLILQLYAGSPSVSKHSNPLSAMGSAPSTYATIFYHGNARDDAFMKHHSSEIDKFDTHMTPLAKSCFKEKRFHTPNGPMQQF